MSEKRKKKRSGVSAQEAWEREPWERMPGESVRNYEHFCAYRDMRYTPAANADELPKLNLKGRRSLRNLADQLGIQNFRTLGNLSARFNWQMRCDAYDLYILRCQRDQNEIGFLKMLDNHAAAGEHFWKSALRRLLSIPQDEIKAGDMVRMFEIGVKIERLSRLDAAEYTGMQNKYGRGAEDGTGGGISESTRREVEELIRESGPDEERSGSISSESSG